MIDLDLEGRQPLHYAAMENDTVATKNRLGCGDDPNLGDRLGFTALHLAAQERSVGAAKILLDHGAIVDQANAYGNTALFVAVLNSRGFGGMIQLLRSRVPILAG